MKFLYVEQRNTVIITLQLRYVRAYSNYHIHVPYRHFDSAVEGGTNQMP